MRTTQQTLVIEHIKKYGSITSDDAFYLYGITRLSDVVFKLRNHGYAVKTATEHAKNRYGTAVSFARYSL